MSTVEGANDDRLQIIQGVCCCHTDCKCCMNNTVPHTLIITFAGVKDLPGFPDDPCKDGPSTCIAFNGGIGFVYTRNDDTQGRCRWESDITDPGICDYDTMGFALLSCGTDDVDTKYYKIEFGFGSGAGQTLALGSETVEGSEEANCLDWLDGLVVDLDNQALTPGDCDFSDATLTITIKNPDLDDEIAIPCRNSGSPRSKIVLPVEGGNQPRERC